MRNIDPARRAWIVLLSAFGLFLVLCLASAILIQWFLLHSMLDLTVELTVSRGTVSVAPSDDAEQVAEREGRFIYSGMMLSTDPTSQAVLTFRDPYDGSVLATLTLLGDSGVTLVSAARPRFDLSADPYYVVLTSDHGRINAFTVSDLDRPLRYEHFTTVHGSMIFAPGGNYFIRIGETSTQVLVEHGRAELSTPAGTIREIVPSQRGVMPDSSGGVRVDESMINLLPNPDFIYHDPTVQTVPTNWGCYDERVNYETAAAQHPREIVDGRAVMHLYRQGEGELDHAETGCKQVLGTAESGLDVSGYDFLELEATIMIRQHSLSMCGDKGSECPVMLRLSYTYEDEEGELHQDDWYHGFYVYSNPEFSLPNRCASCPQEHERVNADSWYTYSSGNLFALLPPGTRSISQVQFYASGHAFESLVDSINLWAETSSPD